MYIYIQKRTLSGPHFPRFWECSVSATSCSIIYDHIYTCDGIARDPDRLSDFLRGCQRLPKNVQRVMKIPREKEGGKTNIVCVYIIYIWLPLGGEVAKDFFLELLPSPSPPVYSPPIYIDGLGFFLVVLLYASMIWMVHK